MQDSRTHQRSQGPTTSSPFSHADLNALLGGHHHADAACPACGPRAKEAINQRRKVLRLYQLDNGGISYRCVRCGEAGWVASDTPSTQMTAEQRRKLEAERRAAQEARERQRTNLVNSLWNKAAPITGTLGEFYFREHRGITCPLPRTMRFIEAYSEYPASIVTRFGLSVNAPLAALHMTRLSPDGRKLDKRFIGYGLDNGPLYVAYNPSDDSETLLITEGIEDALTLHQLNGSSAWAAGSKDKLPGLAPWIPVWVREVMIKYDRDADGGGLIKARELVAAIKADRPKLTAFVF